MQLIETLEEFFSRSAPVARGDRILVAYSGGCDSTALLWGLLRLSERLGVAIHAAHLDHAQDAGSAARAAAAASLAARLATPLTVERIPVGAERRRGESPEAAARRVRYRFLERTRRKLGARYTATGHQRDDQIETVTLRLLLGSGLGGLAAIPARRGALVRPLLSLGREDLVRSLRGAGLEPVEDPSNADLGVPRNRVRHRVLPRLAAGRPDLGRRLVALAEAAAGARNTIESRLERRLAPRRSDGRVTVARRALAELPRELWPWALGLLGRLAGAAYPPAAPAGRDLYRQVRGDTRVGCDIGGGWRWQSRGEELELRRRPAAPAAIGGGFAYTLEVPGEVELVEIGSRLRVSRVDAAPWMFEGERRRAGLELALSADAEVTVRSRLPGDRIRPFGCRHRRRLKDVLIDRRVPREERDRLPLLCVDERIVWVPGVTIDDDCRIGRNPRVWLAELIDR